MRLEEGDTGQDRYLEAQAAPVARALSYYLPLFFFYSAGI